MKAAFLNVDLEIEAATPLGLLKTEMGSAVFVLYSGISGRPKRHHLNLESSRFRRNPDAVIHSLCGVVEHLSPAARRVWDAAARKEFNVGYDLRPTETYSTCALRTGTLRRIADLGATLAVTYYQTRLIEEHKPTK
jgi:hypothetical protein